MKKILSIILFIGLTFTFFNSEKANAEKFELKNSHVAYYENGNMLSEYSYLGTSTPTQLKMYYPNGNLWIEWSFEDKKDIPSTIKKIYDQNGTLVQKIDFKVEQDVHEYKKYKENDKLVLHGRFSKNANSFFNAYYDNGNLAEESIIDERGGAVSGFRYDESGNKTALSESELTGLTEKIKEAANLEGDAFSLFFISFLAEKGDIIEKKPISILNGQDPFPLKYDFITPTTAKILQLVPSDSDFIMPIPNANEMMFQLRNSLGKKSQRKDTSKIKTIERSYYKNGNILTESEGMNKKIYYPNGKLWTEWELSDLKKVSIVKKVYNQKGTLVLDEEIEENKPLKKKSFYSDSGKIKQDCSFSKKGNGSCKIYYPNGELIEETTIKDGHFVSGILYYNKKAIASVDNSDLEELTKEYNSYSKTEANDIMFGLYEFEMSLVNGAGESIAKKSIEDLDGRDLISLRLNFITRATKKVLEHY